ncbi:uncharacterized protein BO87DRAFT_399862 [Aspergillus neoniger CBS 115656]|uniref:Uncharacterized protein n=1 Tax=Aspergillus neoniger (strain CBS 115656) TaxID=1448310 RepID=A0A318Z291_ASPNB|nr:hypothetical protein BO87DRAFT_399862 [Aspergillus neoniger CBS 115656]PYH31172.1 hypothetical protein BO87DRAFT_399862 [Aspergillus neoniger CBS 115656]
MVLIGTVSLYPPFITDMKGYPHGNYGNADRATARSLALSVKPSARGLSQCQQGYQITRKQNLPGRNQPSAHRTILNIGICKKPERNPGRELISHMPIRDS